jgi:hypothetical protein
MGDGNESRALQRKSQCILDKSVGVLVHRGSGLVQQKDLRLSQQGPRKAQQLSLAGTKIGPSHFALTQQTLIVVSYFLVCFPHKKKRGRRGKEGKRKKQRRKGKECAKRVRKKRKKRKKKEWGYEKKPRHHSDIDTGTDIDVDKDIDTDIYIDIDIDTDIDVDVDI